MSETNRQITDQDLRERLLTSLLPDEQKNEYAELIPEMNQDERAQLMEIIGGLETEQERFEKEKQEKLITLNKEFKRELKGASQEEGRHIREETEKFDKGIEAEKLETIDSEIDSAEAKVDRTETAKAQLDTVQNRQEKKKTDHTKRNFILALIGLITLIAVIIIALSSM